MRISDWSTQRLFIEFSAIYLLAKTLTQNITEINESDNDKFFVEHFNLFKKLKNVSFGIVSILDDDRPTLRLITISVAHMFDSVNHHVSWFAVLCAQIIFRIKFYSRCFCL